jgi:structural maintenance of chromosome 2
MNLFETEFKNSKEFLKELEINLENFKSGKGENISMLNINKLIIEAENNKNKSNFEKKNLLNQINFISEENKQKKLKLNEIESKKKTSEKTFNSLKKQITEQEKNLSNLQQQNSTLSTNTEKIERIRNIIKSAEDDLLNFERAQQEILTRFASRLEVNFRDPEPNFDRSKVSGRIIRNIQLKNPKYAKAIEQVAGGKLYNIIVDNENTSSILLNRKCFDYGVVLIPLTKINPKTISNEKKKQIETSANNEAHLALDLIDFNPEFQKAMEFVFGNTFVCNTSEIARKLAYNEKFKVRCVNLDGDEFDPSGIMRGGAVNKNESILKKVDDLNLIQNKIQTIKNNIINNKNEIKNYEIFLKTFNEIKSKINHLNTEIKQYDKDTIEQNIIEINNDIKKNEEEINRCQKRIEELNNFEKKFNDDLIRLKKEKKDFENIDASKKEENYQIKINQTKINIKDYENKINAIKKKINDIDYNINQNKNNINDNEENIKNDKETIENLKNEINDLNDDIEKLTNEYKKLDANLYEKKSELTKNQNELNEIRTKRQNNIDRKDQFNSDLKSLDIKIKQHENSIEESKNYIKKIEKEHEWIKTEKDFFGIKETNYDFNKYNINDLCNKVKKLEDDNEILKRKVNMKVEVMADQYEKEYNELIKKKEIILKDKLNIEKAIKEMDLKRKESLNEIYQQVNKNLNSIYSTLLPQTKAKLEQVKKDDLMDGLQLRVAFNGIWKKSLSELSGGQSSLLALSLILALLLYKPAPIYIFDEIDAALDLSHTANLGLMLREHFPQSQFIVVSLKDGMFNNANVLYKVSYADGSSRVERITKNQL